MRPARVVAWLLFLYWLGIAIGNISFFEGPCPRSIIEFFLYTGIGIVCYHLTLRIGRHFTMPRKAKHYKGISRR